MYRDYPFGSVRFETKNTDEMIKICNYIYGNPEWVDDEGNDCVDFTSLLLTTEDDNLNLDLFNSASNAINAVNKIFEEKGITADYKIFYEGKNPEDNFFIKNGIKIHQYVLPSSDDVDKTYQTIIDCIEDGDIYLGWFDEAEYVEICAYYNGKIVGGRTIIVETDETNDECYNRIDDKEYYLKLCSTDLKLADSVSEFHELSNKEINEKCASYFRDNSGEWEEFFWECAEKAGLDDMEGFDPGDFKYKVIPFNYEETEEENQKTSDETSTESTATVSVASSVKCSNCGTENAAGNSFCETCGTKLAGSTVAERAAWPSIEERMNKMQADMDAKLDSFFGKK